MLQIEGLQEGLEIFKTLGSEVRMRIVELLAQQGSMNLNEIATALELTNSAVTSHIRKMEETGIIHVEQDQTGKGNQKVCSLAVKQLLLSIPSPVEKRNLSVYEAEIPIGDYEELCVRSDYGLALPDRLAVGESEGAPLRVPCGQNAQMLWFHDGFVEYRIPNQVPEGCIIAQLTLIFEISSADLQTQAVAAFSLEGVSLGTWRTFENDFSRGYYSPSWYRQMERQHGFLKMLVINRGGVFLDGVRIAEISGEHALRGDGNELRFRIGTHPADGAEGGIALYGAAFGNYNQPILARVHWAEPG